LSQFSANCFCLRPYVQFTDQCEKFGECVYQQSEAFSHQIAQNRCADYNANMTDILSAKKDAFLKDLAAGEDAQSLWLGATRVDGKYTWTSSGEAVSGYEPWAENQPNVADGNCAFEDFKTGKWSSASCDELFTVHNFACQKIACE
uniref:C-type lectin domain-containing protein n=1 Tax=Anisakis simplex TaxID=6269 RepID=A0A0M3J1R1_ANISI